jgi:hypothetical protein
VPIRRHTQIKAAANRYNAEWEVYLEERLGVQIEPTHGDIGRYFVCGKGRTVSARLSTEDHSPERVAPLPYHVGPHEPPTDARWMILGLDISEERALTRADKVT